MKFILVGLSLAVVCSCGFFRMPGEVEGTRKEVEKTNEKLSVMEEETSQLRRLTGELLQKMDRTNDGVHLQILTLSLQNLMSDYATALLTPPVRMMPFATEFAKEASPTEIISVFHTLYTEALRGYERFEGGNLRVKERMIALTAAEAIAGFTPEEKVRAIFSSELEKGGKFQATAGAFGRCRFAFIRNWLLDPMILEEYQTPVNFETLKASTEYLKQLNELATSPYVDQFRVNIPHLGDLKEAALEDQINPKQVKAKAKLALAKFKDFSAEGAEEQLQLLRAMAQSF